MTSIKKLFLPLNVSAVMLLTSLVGFAASNDVQTFRFGNINGVSTPTRMSSRDARLVFEALNLEAETQYVRNSVKSLKVGLEALTCVESFNAFCLISLNVRNLEEGTNGELILKGDFASALYENLNDTVLTRDGSKNVGNISCKRYYRDSAECTIRDVR